MSVLRVAKAGFLSSVQDAGRRGLRSIGLGQSGALDSLARRIANILACNDEDAAVLELTVGNAEFVFTDSRRFAVTGADMHAKLGTTAVAPWSTTVAHTGDVLRFHTAKSGVRAVLALEGGIAVDPVLGSRSTDLNAGFGGFAGRAVRAGDELPLGMAQARAGTFRVKPPAWDFDARSIGVIACNEIAGADDFWTQRFRIAAQSDRIGARLLGDRPLMGAPVSVPSHAVFPGVIQLPPNGLPIVLLNDAQTTGGYAKLGVVCDADLWKFADLVPSAAVSFASISIEQAQRAREALERYVSAVTQSVNEKLPV